MWQVTATGLDLKVVEKFPSPYGVIFILIIVDPDKQSRYTSVTSFRLLTELYSFLYKV